jgi:hypothetical protein
MQRSQERRVRSWYRCTREPHKKLRRRHDMDRPWAVVCIVCLLRERRSRHDCACQSVVGSRLISYEEGPSIGTCNTMAYGQGAVFKVDAANGDHMGASFKACSLYSFDQTGVLHPETATPALKLRTGTLMMLAVSILKGGLAIGHRIKRSASWIT